MGFIGFPLLKVFLVVFPGFSQGSIGSSKGFYRVNNVVIDWVGRFDCVQIPT